MDKALELQVFYEPWPAELRCRRHQREFIRVGRNNCVLLAPSGEEIPVEISVVPPLLHIVQGGGMAKAADSGSAAEVTLTPSSVVEALEGSRLSLCGAWPHAELEFRFGGAVSAAHVARALVEAIGCVIRSLFAPAEVKLTAPTGQARTVANHAGHAVAAAQVVYIPAIEEYPPRQVYQMRYMELYVQDVGFCANTVRLFTDSERDNAAQVIGLGQCMVIHFTPGNHSVMLEDRDLHQLAFADLSEAELWANLLKEANEASGSMPFQTPELGRAIDALQGAKERTLTWGAAAYPRCEVPLLVRGDPPSPWVEPPDDDPRYRKFMENPEGFDVSEVLKGAQSGGARYLPPPSDTCHVNVSYVNAGSGSFDLPLDAIDSPPPTSRMPKPRKGRRSGAGPDARGGDTCQTRPRSSNDPHPEPFDLPSPSDTCQMRTRRSRRGTASPTSSSTSRVGPCGAARILRTPSGRELVHSKAPAQPTDTADITPPVSPGFDSDSGSVDSSATLPLWFA